nr:protein FAM32A-like isoform X2 [Malus domestica]
MSSYENVVGGKLKLKGKALDVKAAGMKKKKKHKKHQEQTSSVTETELSADGSTEVTNPDEEEINDSHKSGEEGKAPHYGDLLTPAERRYIEQRERIDNHRLAKTANKSHRDRIQDFNQYLANMSEHYDIPKVGPG